MNDNVNMEENKKLRKMIDNSRKLINEEWYDEDDGELSNKEIKILAREMKKFNEYGKALFPDEDRDLIVLAKKITKLAKLAEQYLNDNVDEDFDRVTINRNMKELDSYVEDFQELAKELKEKQERLAALYEDIGVVFNRYFDVKDREEVNFDEKAGKASKNEWLKGKY